MFTRGYYSPERTVVIRELWTQPRSKNKPYVISLSIQQALELRGIWKMAEKADIYELFWKNEIILPSHKSAENWTLRVRTQEGTLAPLDAPSGIPRSREMSSSCRIEDVSFLPQLWGRPAGADRSRDSLAEVLPARADADTRSSQPLTIELLSKWQQEWHHEWLNNILSECFYQDIFEMTL